MPHFYLFSVRCSSVRSCNSSGLTESLNSWGGTKENFYSLSKFICHIHHISREMSKWDKILLFLILRIFWPLLPESYHHLILIKHCIHSNWRIFFFSIISEYISHFSSKLKSFLSYILILKKQRHRWRKRENLGVKFQSNFVKEKEKETGHFRLEISKCFH